jgi:tetratricopeptide (TPR) repeat protein
MSGDTRPHPETLSATQAEELDRACDRFEAAWRDGGRPRIEEYLDGADGPLAAALAGELIAVEVQWRRRRGESPEPGEYRDRFPGDHGSISALFGTTSRDTPTGPPEPRAASFERVVTLCQTFASEWRPSQRPDIPSFLDRVADDSRETLLRNLLYHEIDRRRREGEQPRAEDYIKRFPKFADAVRQVFLESTSSATGIDLGHGEDSHDTVAPAASRLGDYRLVRELGRGGMGVVFEAVHVVRGNRVALKLLPQVDGIRLYRFKREFRSAADLSHPNLIGLHTLESDAGQWFFTMDLLEGADFLGYVRPDGRLEPARLRAVLAQLVLGVMALHRNHIIHRDLKPSNVMVTPEGRVILLDFGLVLETEEADQTRTSDRFAGTPAYMAPEQAAGLKVTPASDWYAIGVMLYEALAGQRPYRGHPLQVLQQKQLREPDSLPDDPDIPADLAALCLDLLARDPRQRPGTFEIAKKTSSTPEPAVVSFTGVGGSHLVGRDPHLAALMESYRTVCRLGTPQTVFISGRSGEGKTTLVEQFLASLRRDRNLVVMGGRCYDRESVPFKALDSLIDALGSYLKALPETDAALLMPDDIGFLAHVFPVLQRVGVVARSGALRVALLDEQQVRTRACVALRSLLVRISRRTPVVWFIDDLQWGDADSAEALFEILKPPEAPQLFLLGTYRSDEVERSAFLNTWNELGRKYDPRVPQREVTLAPLTVEECTELLVALLGKDTERIRRRAVEFARETRGNPFLLIELAGCFDPETDSFESMPLHEVLGRKLGRLPDEAGPLLDVVAVSGQALALEEASRTAGHAAPPMATITRMRNEHLVRLIGSEQRPLVDTYHDRVRETVVGRLEPGRCQAIHRTLAEVIESTVGAAPDELQKRFESWEHAGEREGKNLPRVYDLAYHFDAAGEARKAWIFALCAGEQARRQAALEVAANNFAIARRNAAGTKSAVRYRISEGQGGTLMLLGRYEDAARELKGAIDLAEDPERKARIEALRGELAFKQGSMDGSVALYENGLRRLGYRVPRTTPGFAWGVLRELVIQGGHSLRPQRLHQRPPSSEVDLAVRLLFRATHAYAFRNTLKMLWAHLAGLNRCELHPPTIALAGTYAFHDCASSMLGWPGRGTRYGDRAIALARELDDAWMLGQSRNYKGIGLYASAHYEQGLACLGEAIAYFEKAGDLCELNLAHFHKGCCHFGLGNLAEAVAEARWAFAASVRLGDSRTLCSSYLWARATRGNIPFEDLRSCYPNRPDDIMSTVHGMMAEGHWHTFHGRTEEALGTFECAAELVRKNLCVNSHMIVVLPELAAAVRRHAATLKPKNQERSQKLRRRALRLARWAVRITRLFPAAYPLSLRELSLVLADQGKLDKALQIVDRSCAVAETQKARYEHAQSLLVRGTLARRLGRPEADEQIRTAEAALDALERPVRAGAVASPTGQPEA